MRKAQDAADAAAEPSDMPATSHDEGQVEEASGFREEAADSEGQAESEEPLGPEPLPAGLTALMLKGCGATEVGTLTTEAMQSSLSTTGNCCSQYAFRICASLH